MRRFAVLIVGLLATFVASSSLWGAPFTTGHLVVSRIGGSDDDLHTFPDSASRVGLLEIDPTNGSIIQTVQLPALTTDVAGSNNHMLTLSSDFRAGMLHRSVDGLFLVIGGFDAAAKNGNTPGVPLVVRTVASSVNRVVARIDNTGAVNTTTAINNSQDSTQGPYDGGKNASFRAVASLDGSGFWLAGRSDDGNSRDGRVQWVPYQGTQSNRVPTNSHNSFDDARNVNVFNNQLLAVYNIESVSNGFHRGTYAITANSGLDTLPTAVGSDIANYPQIYDQTGIDSDQSPYDVYFTDADTAYLSNDDLPPAGGLLKFVRDADPMSPTFNQYLYKYTLSAGLPSTHQAVRSVVGAPDGNGHVVLYAITAASIATNGDLGNNLVTITDTGCPTGAEAGCTAADTFTILQTAGDLEVYRGVAYAPIPCQGTQCNGACCEPLHTCVDNMTASACAAAGGVFRGIETTCATMQCALVCHTPFADADGDGDVDMDDFGQFQRCYTGDTQTLVGDCACFDRPDNSDPQNPVPPDGHINLFDFNKFVNCASGANVPANPACGG